MPVTARDFPAIFADGWRDPDGAGGIMRFFGPYLDEAVEMTGPMTPRIRGIRQVEEYFRLLFAVIPDLHGEVVESRAVDDRVVFVTVLLRGTIGGRPVSLTLRDRLVVEDGRLVLREAHGVPVGMTLAILRTPSAWRAAARLMLRVRWSAPARA